MRKAVVLASMVFAVTLLQSERANACQQAPSNAGLYAELLAIPTAGILDLSFTIYDLSVDNPNPNACAAEVVVMLPQIAFGIWGATKLHGTPAKALLLTTTVWPLELAIHGFWGLGRGYVPSPDRPPPKQTFLRIVPSAISDGTNLAPGVLAVGRF